MKMRLFLAFGLMLSLAFLGSAEEQKAMSHKMTGKTMSKAEKIKNAMSSAPMPIA